MDFPAIEWVEAVPRTILQSCIYIYCLLDHVFYLYD